MIFSLNQSTSFDDSSLLALSEAFKAVMTTLKSHDPLHDWDNDVALRTKLANILLELAQAGNTDPYVLRSQALERLPLPPMSVSLSGRQAALEA